MDYGGLIWIMDYCTLSLINGAYDGLWTIMDYRGLMELIMGYGPSWTIVDYCGTLWMIVDYHWFFDMHRYGIAWIARYAPLCTPRL